MSCPTDVNTGFIQLGTSPNQQDLDNITIKKPPVSISFSPRSNPITLRGNRIEENTERNANTCTYKGVKYDLADVQIAAPLHTGYRLPGIVETPVAELVLSFHARTTANSLMELTGIMLCLPIYDSGTPMHDAYLNQLQETILPKHPYTTQPGSMYSGGDYNQPFDSTLGTCVKSCCGDTNCLAYTFKTGKCYLKNTIPNLSKTHDLNTISGTVDRTVPLQCTPPPSTITPTLESLFYQQKGDSTQTSLAYKTCFETVPDPSQPTKFKSYSLFVVVFPNGIHLASCTYQNILLQMGGRLRPFALPPALRDQHATLEHYTFENGVKTVNDKLGGISRKGVVYTTSPFSSCSDEFVHRFQYYTFPPRLPIQESKTATNATQSYYPTSQYKCVPFNQMTDLDKTGKYVIPGNKSLDTILAEQKQKEQNDRKDDHTDTSDPMNDPVIFYGTYGTIIGTGIVFCVIAKLLFDNVFNKPSR